jgi:hypothetical protein
MSLRQVIYVITCVMQLEIRQAVEPSCIAHSLSVVPWQPLAVTAFVGKGKAFMSQKNISSLYASFSLIFTVASADCSPSGKNEGRN